MFSDVIGHKEIVERLKNALRSGRIANAYIFSGPVGVGKEFVATNYHRFKDIFISKREKIPKAVAGLDGIYSLKRLAE